MNWSALGPLVAVAAPPLAKILLGEIPIVGPIIAGVGGDAIGAILAKQFGVAPTPEAVKTAIEGSTPEERIEKIKAAAAEAAAKYPVMIETAKADAQAASAEVQATSATMSAELVNGTAWQRNWRPLIGYVSAFLIFVFGVEIAIAIAIALVSGKLDVMNAVLAGITSIVFYLSVPGSITGAVSIGRSFEKVKGLQVGSYGGFIAGAASVAGPKVSAIAGPIASIGQAVKRAVSRVIPGSDRMAGG